MIIEIFSILLGWSLVALSSGAKNGKNSQKQEQEQEQEEKEEQKQKQKQEEGVGKLTLRPLRFLCRLCVK